MVTEDPALLDGFTPEEEEEMVAEMIEKRKRKYSGKRANNLAAGVDAKRTVERLMLEVRSYTLAPLIRPHRSRRLPGSQSARV